MFKVAGRVKKEEQKIWGRQSQPEPAIIMLLGSHTAGRKQLG